MHYVETGGTCSFYWEFGGNDAIAMIWVPPPDEWDSLYPWAQGRRDEILGQMAEAVRRKQVSSGSIEITENIIYFRRK